FYIPLDGVSIWPTQIPRCSMNAQSWHLHRERAIRNTFQRVQVSYATSRLRVTLTALPKPTSAIATVFREEESIRRHEQQTTDNHVISALATVNVHRLGSFFAISEILICGLLSRG